MFHGLQKNEKKTPTTAGHEALPAIRGNKDLPEQAPASSWRFGGRAWGAFWAGLWCQLPSWWSPVEPGGVPEETLSFYKNQGFKSQTTIQPPFTYSRLDLFAQEEQPSKRNQLKSGLADMNPHLNNVHQTVRLQLEVDGEFTSPIFFCLVIPFTCSHKGSCATCFCLGVIVNRFPFG